MDFFSFRKSVPVLLLLILFAWSCDSVFNSDDYEFDDLELSPTMVAPLGFGDMNVRDLLESEDSAYIKVYPDGLVYIEYNQVLRSKALRDIITIPDKDNVNEAIVVPPGILPPVNSDYTSTEQESIEYLDVTPEEFSEILIKQGNILYDVTLAPSNPDFRYAVILTIPEFTRPAGGGVFSQEVSGSGQLDLSGLLYSSVVPNRITLRYTLVIKENPNATTITPGTVANVNLSFRGLDYSYVKGFFADQTVNLPTEQLNINAFGHAFLDGANVSFAQPTVEFVVINEVGVPTQVLFDVLEARKPGDAISLQIDPASPVTITPPAVLGDSALTNIQVLNTSEVIDFAPTNFFYEARARINTGLTSGNNFIADTSELKVRMHVEVPLYGNASNIVLSDTVEIDLTDVDESNIESAALKVKATNQLPIQARIQFLLADENYTIFDSLLAVDQTLLIKSSEVDSNGELLTAGVVDELIPIEQTKINRIFETKNIIIRARVSTTPGSGNTFPDVRFKSDYRLNVNLGLQAKLKIEAEL